MPAKKILQPPARNPPSPRRGRKCTVCSHVARAAIDGALVAGLSSLRNVAECHGVGLFSLFRHASHHLPQTLAKATEAAEITRADELLNQVLEIRRQTREILARAIGSGDDELALKALGRRERQIELEARLRGELEPPSVNVIVSAQWIQLRGLIMQVLRSHPEAQRDVAVALQSYDVAG